MKKLKTLLLFTLLILFPISLWAGTVISNVPTYYNARQVITVSLTGADSVTISGADLAKVQGMWLFSEEHNPSAASAPNAAYTVTITGASGQTISSTASCSTSATGKTDYINYPIREAITIATTVMSSGTTEVVLTFTVQ